MPKYKLGNDTYTLPEYEVQGFLAKFPDAILIEEEEGKTNGVAETGATVTPTTGQAPESMELDLVDTSSVSQPNQVNLDELKKTLPSIPEEGASRLQQEQFARDVQTVSAKSQAAEYTQQIQDMNTNLPASDITAQEAIDVFGFVEPREAKVSQPGYQVPGQMAPTVSYVPMFNSDQEYNSYLKKTLGDNYESYINYLDTGEIDISDKESRLNARKQVVQRQTELFTIANDIPEDVQKYMMFEPKFATGNSKEEQEFAVNELKKSYDTNFANYEVGIKEWEAKAVPLTEKINEIQSQLQGFTYDENNQPILSSEDQVNQYNSLVQQNNDAIQQWEKQGFGVLYNTLVKQEEVLQIELDNYNSMLDDSRQALVDAEANTDAIAKDYTFAARVGESWDRFFFQNLRNFGDLGLQVGFKSLDWLTGGKYSVAFDGLIDVISENNKNYNLEMSKKAENIPAAPTLDEIDQQGVDYWDWFSISFQDNSPVIATTFIPAGASLKGASLVKSAVGTAAKKTALQQQKRLLLAGKRTAQSVFFTAETGGKFGELQLENEDYSLFQKALTSYLYGTAATYAETLGTLRLVTGGRNIAKNIGTKAARKEFYTRPSRFGFNVVGATLKGLKTLPKGIAIEQIEETATQLSHNYFDIVVLNKDKSLIDGLNKDFFANVAVTSFGIMSPTTSSNIINGVKNEFRTRSEILDNQKLTQELIGLTEAPATADSRIRKQEILEELALNDAISLHKLRYMSASDIERVADLNRQMRQLQGQMNMLGKTGERSETAKRRKAEIKTEYDKLITTQQEILNAKERNLKEREKNLNESLGVAAQNTEAAYWLGVTDFYEEIAMTQMGDGDYIDVQGDYILNDFGQVVGINYDNLDEKLSKYKGQNILITDEITKEDKVVDAADHFKSVLPTRYGIKFGKDIIINRALINQVIGQSPTSKEAQWAAVAPLEELFHLSVAGKKINFENEEAQAAINEVRSVLKDKLDLDEISLEVYDEFNARINLYKDKKKFDAEEFIAQLNNMVALGDINLSDISEIPSLKTFLNSTIRSVFGDMSWMLNLKTSGDVFNLIKNFQSDVERQVIQTAPEDEEIKESTAEQASQQVQEIYEQQGVAGAFDIIEQFKPITAKLVQRRAEAPGFDRQLLTDEIETGARGILDLIREYNPDSGVPLAAYINKFLPARAIEASKRVLGEEFTADVTEAKGVVAEEASVEVTAEPKGPKKPTETTRFSDTALSNLGVKSKAEAEKQISDATNKAFEGEEVKRFGQTKNVPVAVAEIYGKMFGVNPETIYDKKRNYSKKDSEGLTRIKQYLIDNATSDFARLPRTKDDFGKATFIPNNVMNALYTDGELTGTLKDYLDLIREKPVKPIYRDRVGQTIRGLFNTSIRNRMVEDLIPGKPERARAGVKFSKAKQQPKTVAKPMFSKAMRTLFDLQLPGRLKVDSLLDRLNLDKTLNLKELVLTPEGRKQIVDTFRDEIFILLPKEAWQQRDSFTSTGKNYGVSMSKGTVEEIAGYNQLKEDLNKAIDAAPEAAFGAPVLDKDGNVVDFKISGYATVFKGTQAEIKKKALEFNRKVTSIHETMWDRIAERVNEDKSRASAIATYLKLTANDKSSWHRRGAAIFGYSPNPTGVGKTKYEMEHAMPATAAYLYLLDSAIQNAGRDESNFKDAYKLVTDNYKLIALDKAENKKLGAAGLGTAMPKGWDVLNNFWWQRYFNPQVVLEDGGIDPSLIVDLDGKTFQDVFNIDASGANITPAIINEQNKIIKSSIKASKSNASKLPNGLDLNNPTSWDRFDMLDVVTRQKFPRTQYDLYPYEALTIDEKIEVVKAIPGLQTTVGLKFSKTSSAQDVLGVMRGVDDSIDKARNADAPVKGISVWDFDDTLATTKSNVLYEMPDGTTGVLNAEQFAKQGEDLLQEGAVFDFSEFEKVTKGAKGPMFEKAVARNKKFGNENVFILTARTQAAAEPIQQFLKAIGLDIPLKNIVGLGDSTPAAKASWVVGKAREGYNDFYFADDAYKNVKAVQDALSVLDVKSKVRQAYVKFSKASALDKGFNDILEQTTGIASEKEYKKVKAEVAGASRGRVFRGIPYSAQDFVGLLYETLGKGKLGDAQMAWYKQHLIQPFARAMNDIDNARLNMLQDYRALKKQLGVVPKDLRKKVPGEPYTREQAVRVYIWNVQGTDVPGISKQDLKDLTKYVQDNAELQVFADQIIAIQKGDQYAKPQVGWPAGSITTDILRGINTGVRAKYLQQWQDNVDVIFSEKNMNKLEAAYGKPYRKAMENMLQRMKTGRNRTFSDDSLTGRFTDWLQGSIGTIMFFNTRSALLQTISSVNFINFTDNNPLAAARAFANQKQYWSDFMTLINSDFLKARRSGLRFNVTEADIANMAKEGGPRAVVNRLLQLGFAPTQIADSFAIASGGATFYRNRIKSLMKQGMSKAEAETQAFENFRENAEESQQSARPDRISMQQAGPLGRLILAFANTPAQYARLTDKAIRDLKNNRGDAKTNISKIIYYTTVQNLIFNALQQAIFALAFDDEEPEDEEKKDKYISIANGMADSLLRGTGFAGAAVSVGKNAIIRIFDEMEKKQPKLEKVGYELTKISPPISAKLSRINQAARSYQWDKDEMINGGWGLDNPAYLAAGNVISALTNVPIDRGIKKMNNIVKATDTDLEAWERLALIGGWQDWEIGLGEETKQNKPQPRKTKKKSNIKTTPTKKM